MEEVPAEFISKWGAYFHVMGTTSAATTTIGLGTVLIIAVLRRCAPRLPGMLIAMMSATLAVALFRLDVETIGGRFGALPRMLPIPSLTPLEVGSLNGLVPAAFTVAFLAAIESLLSATVADGMIGGKHRPNTELIAQGIANIRSIVFGGIPATGAIARTATNVKSGARTPVTGLVHAIVLLLILLLFAPLAAKIPLASPAGILVVVSYNMSEYRHFASILKGPRSDRLVLLLTFALTVLVDLTLAVQVGIVLSSLLFMRRMSELANVNAITRDLKGDTDPEYDPMSITLREVPAGVEVYEINGPFFFGMGDTFWNALREIERPVPVLIIRIRNVPAIDATGLHVLEELHRKCQRQKTQLIFSGVTKQPMSVFTKSGFLSEVGPENFCSSIDEALARVREILSEW